MFGATKIVRNSDKEKYINSGCGIAFGGKGSWSFARNVIIFGVDNISSSHTDYLKNDFLTLSEGHTLGINGSFGALEKN